MKTPFFTPKDFTLQDDGAVDLRAVRHAAYANEKFDKMIAQGEAVYAALWSDGKRRDWIKDSAHPANVYKGVVIFIEEIKPKCEKHEPYFGNLSEFQRQDPPNTPAHLVTNCRFCGIDLVADWKVK